MRRLTSRVPRRTIARVCAFATLGALAGAACDASDEGVSERTRARAVGSTDSGAVAVTSAGCAIVGEADVEEALGFEVVLNDNSTGNCLITPADGSPAAPVLDIRREDRTSAFDYFAAQPDATPVSGLGDRAVWATVNQTTGSLVVITGESALVVSIARADGLDARERRQAEALARRVMGTRR